MQGFLDIWKIFREKCLKKCKKMQKNYVQFGENVLYYKIAMIVRRGIKP